MKHSKKLKKIRVRKTMKGGYLFYPDPTNPDDKSAFSGFTSGVTSLFSSGSNRDENPNNWFNLWPSGSDDTSESAQKPKQTYSLNPLNWFSSGSNGKSELYKETTPLESTNNSKPEPESTNNSKQEPESTNNSKPDDALESEGKGGRRTKKKRRRSRVNKKRAKSSKTL